MEVNPKAGAVAHGDSGLSAILIALYCPSDIRGWQTAARRTVNVAMVANPLSGPDRLTVVRLPILGVVLETLALPFKYPAILIRYEWIPFVGLVASRLISWILLTALGLWQSDTIWLIVTHVALFTPFSVAWSRVAIRGADVSLPARPFEYQATEWKYFLANAIMIVAVGALLGLPMILYQHAMLIFDRRLTGVAAILVLLGTAFVALGFLRFAFVFPAIAIDRFEGIVKWGKQTAGNFEPLAAAIALSCAPYLVVEVLVRMAADPNAEGVAAMAGRREVAAITMTVASG